jgi:hypothetical protein
MRKLASCLALLATLALGLRGAPAGKSADATAERLVKQLGSRKYAERAAATRQLEALGEPALPALRRAAATADLETRRRAEVLVVRVEQRAEAARLLAGKRVRLVYRDTPLVEAVEDFAARTGFDLRLDDDAAGQRERRITLDTGATTAWDALRQFCRETGLAEAGPPQPDDDLSDPTLRLTHERVMPLPTHLAGAVRVRALPLGSAKGGPPGSVGFRLEGQPEPGMPWQGVVGVCLAQAVDERGQELKQSALSLGGLGRPPLPTDSPAAWDALSGRPVWVPAERRATAAWLTPGNRPAARLREVQGHLIVQAPVSRQLLAVDRLLQAEGKTFDGTRGQSLEVLQAQRADDTLRLRVRLRAHGGDLTFHVARTRKGSLVMRGGQGRTLIGFVLQGMDGATLRPQACEQAYFPNRGVGGLRMEFQLTFALKAGQAVPDRLICNGPVPTLIEVPFTLRDVPLAAAPITPPR